MPAPRLRAPASGEVISGRFLQSVDVRLVELEAALARPAGLPGPKALEAQTVSAAAVAWYVAVVLTEANDTIAAFIGGIGNVTVAKPRDLRGATAARTVAYPGGSEDQVIVKPYSGSDLLLVADIGEGLTGLAGVSLMDMNNDARAWAKEF